jgi:hypothetical protein
MAFFHRDVIRTGVPILAAALLLAGCLGHYRDDPPRPKKVPKTAAWARTSDGIVWIVCKGGKGGDQCTVYSGSTGDTLVKGTFFVAGTNGGLPTDKLNYDYFDGKSILLGDGRMLQYFQVPSKSKTGDKGHGRRKKQA